MFPHTVDAGELLTDKRLSGGCSALMTFARKTGAAIVVNIFTAVLTFTGYDANLDVQPEAAQNGIKYVMAFTCIAFMIFGFIMAKRYVLSHEMNAKVEKYLAIKREGKIGELSAEEMKEYNELTELIA